MKKIEKISYAKTVYGQAEIDAVVECLETSTQMGKNTYMFENEIAKIFDKRFCLYVNSGSSALYLGIEALNLPKGSEVITPALTFSTTVASIIKNDLIPVFVDVKPLTFCIDEDQIEAMISNKTVAILAPNLIGNICNWSKISEIAKKYNLLTIEDSADTLGGQLHGKGSGTYTDISITSFYGSHIINCAGNGGALAMNDPSMLRKAKLLRSWGRASSIFDQESEKIENRFNAKIEDIDYDAKFVFESLGYNLEGSEIGAAFGLVQLRNLRNNIITRNNNFDRLTDFFKQYEKHFELPKKELGAHSGWLAYPILISDKTSFSRRSFQIALEEKEIQTRVVFTGNVIRQPMLKNKKFRVRKQGYPNADKVMKYGVLLPLHHGMTDVMFERLEGEIQKFLASKRF